MKKLFALILSLVYITTSSGMVFSDHFCMGKQATKKCLCSKKEKKSDCCKDEYKVVKLDNAHQASFVKIECKVPVAIIPAYSSLIEVSNLPGQLLQLPVAHGPPLWGSPNIFLLNCVFRI